MGQAASVVRKQIEADQVEQKKQFDDSMESLRQMAEGKIDKFYEDIEGGRQDNKLLPMHYITGKFSFFQCKVSEDSDALKGQVKQLIGDLAGGHWADALADAASDVIGDMLANSAASISQKQTYAVSMNELGGIQRLDALYISYSFTSTAMINLAQNMVACMIVKSSVDCKDMDDNTLRLIVSDSFPGTTNVKKAQLYEDLAGVVLVPGPTEKQIAATKALETLYALDKQAQT